MKTSKLIEECALLGIDNDELRCERDRYAEALRHGGDVTAAHDRLLRAAVAAEDAVAATNEEART